MDLIYTDSNGIEQGVLLHYTFDLAYGADENDFELTLDIKDHCLAAGCSIYIESTEYGGVIDSISVDTKDNNVVYKGRTWQGILGRKILCPDTGHDYLTVSGEANNVIRRLLSRVGLTDVFAVSTENSGITVSYQFDRYCDAYSGIVDMLSDAGAKLIVERTTYRTMLSAEPIHNYFTDDEWDSSQFEFEADMPLRATNHLVCLGQGDLKDRAVIHLFTDEDGTVQPYKKKSVPLEDSDYILDTSKQVLSGDDEIAEVYDYSGAEIAENYVLTTSQPTTWAKACDSFYTKSGSEYEAVEWLEVPKWSVLKSSPADWSSNYGSYFVSSDGGYVGVEESTSYKKVSAASDWETNYSSYYQYELDDSVLESITYTYQSVEGVPDYRALTSKPVRWADKFDCYYQADSSAEDGYSKIPKTSYSALTSKPSDWSTNYADYFVKSGTSYNAAQSVDAYKSAGSSAPSDWDVKYHDYYYKNDDGNYESVSAEDKYIKLSWYVDDWDNEYSDYYVISDDGDYDPVKTVETILPPSEYVAYDEKPKNWSKIYNELYYKDNDGTQTTYRAISSVSREVYTVQTSKPSRWDSEFSKYYVDGETYKSVEWDEATKNPAPKWEYNTYFSYNSSTKSYTLSTSKPDDWDTSWNTYYTREEVTSITSTLTYYQNPGKKSHVSGVKSGSKIVAPTYKASTYYALVNHTFQLLTATKIKGWKSSYSDYYEGDTKANTWKANTFYKRKQICPLYVPSRYYSNSGGGNYTLLTSSDAPDDWATSWFNYYKKVGDNFVQLTQYKYTLTTKKPSDWSDDYADYWCREGFENVTTSKKSYVYTRLSGTSKPKWQKNKYYSHDESTDEYILTMLQPSNWATDYADYFVRHSGKISVPAASDGFAPNWKKNTYYTKSSVSHAPDYDSFVDEYGSVYYHNVADLPPAFELGRYYQKIKSAPTYASGKYYEKYEAAPTFVSGSYYKQSDSAPTWSSGKYYQRYTVAPTFVANKYYKQVTGAPAFKPNTYYRKTMKQQAPNWAENTFYRLAQDRYSELVKGGIKKLNEAWQKVLSASLDDDDNDYDIGDIVGATDEETGLSVSATVNKKIVTITDGIASVEYEV